MSSFVSLSVDVIFASLLPACCVLVKTTKCNAELLRTAL